VALYNVAGPTRKTWCNFTSPPPLLARSVVGLCFHFLLTSEHGHFVHSMATLYNEALPLCTSRPAKYCLDGWKLFHSKTWREHGHFPIKIWEDLTHFWGRMDTWKKQKNVQFYLWQNMSTFPTSYTTWMLLFIFIYFNFIARAIFNDSWLNQNE